MAADAISKIFGEPNDTQKLEKGGKKILWIVGLLGLIFIALGGYIFFTRYYRTATQSEAPVPAPQVTAPRPVQAPAGQPTAVPTLPEGTANYESENFKVGEVAIGGEAEIVVDQTTDEPLALSDIHAEAFTEKNKDRAELVISWATTRLAQSTITYSKGVGQTEKTIEESDYSLSHAVIIPDLDQASTYVYTIKSTDRFGNSLTSEPRAVSTGSRTVSLFELIAQALGNIFGWAVKK